MSSAQGELIGNNGFDCFLIVYRRYFSESFKMSIQKEIFIIPLEKRIEEKIKLQL